MIGAVTLYGTEFIRVAKFMAPGGRGPIMPWLVAAAFALVALISIVPLARAQTEARVALVIGNGAYEHLPRLDNPPSDARLIAETLKELGFTLIGGGAQLDLDRAAFERTIREFGANLADNSVGLFYYAGHGVQVQGENYLIPVGANPTGAADVDYELIDAELVLKQMRSAGSKLNFVILDACRNNPFGGRGLRDASGGLAQMQAPSGTLISYATQPGNVALDGSNGHSPYTQALAETLRKPGLRVLDVFNEVGLAVDEKTLHRQQPWQSSSPINGNFYFLGQTNVTVQPPASQADAEIVFWQSVSASGNAADFEEYLRKYPNGRFVGLARNRIAALRPPPAERPPAAEPAGAIDGTWSGTVLGNGFRYSVTVVLEHHGDKVVGRMTEANEGKRLETLLSGQIAGDEIYFSKQYPAGAGSLSNRIFNYKLMLSKDGGFASGAWSGDYAPPNNAGRFEMTKK